MKIEKLKNVPFRLLYNCLCKYTDMGNVKEIMYIYKKFDGEQFGVKKLSKDDYMICSTGEVKQYVHSETRKDNTESLRKTFKKLRNIINANFHGGRNELMFTTTYKENMTDRERLMKDFEKFIKKVKYRYGNVEYMNIVEPQGRGAWHCHVLLRFDDVKKIYIPNKDIADMWGKGFVTVRRLRQDVDNLGAYLSAYLGDIEVNSENSEIVKEYVSNNKIVEYKEVEVDGKKKKFIKGGRLHLYPVGMNIYRKSRGIKEPVPEMLMYEDIPDIGALKPSYVSQISICNDDGEEMNKIIYEVYNTKKGRKQHERS